MLYRIVASAFALLSFSSLAAAAPMRTLDLTPFGLTGVTNPDYRARMFTSAIDYLADGTMVVAFPAPSNSLDQSKVRPIGMQRDVILHLNPKDGTVLHRLEERVSNDIRALSATPDGGFLLVEGRSIVFFDAHCNKLSTFQVPGDVTSLEVSPSHRYLMLASGGSTA
ncbi:MAG: hypothetical protein JOZ43_07090, partial [Acidobacteriales bacterium]|nr:hypothetical protein [Terriglobales bacterium]